MEENKEIGKENLMDENVLNDNSQSIINELNDTEHHSNESENPINVSSDAAQPTLEEAEEVVENQPNETVEPPLEIPEKEVVATLETEENVVENQPDETVEPPLEIPEKEVVATLETEENVVENQPDETVEPPLEIPEKEVVITLEPSDVTEREVDLSDKELVKDFSKELASTKEQKLLHEEEKKETVEEEVILDYQTYQPEALINELDALISSHPIDAIKGRVAAIKLAFLSHEKAAKEAAKKAEETMEASQEKNEANEDEKTEKAAPPTEYVYPFTARFNAIFDQYKQKKAKLMEHLEKEKENNLEQKNKILEELRTLLVSDQTLKVTYDRFRELQEEWKNIGMVPKQEIAMLWNNYHFLIERFFDKVRIHRELRELDLKKNLELKITLCEKIEELLLEDKIANAFRTLADYHKQWKEIGTVPDENRVEIWDRFKLATDTINQRHRDFYEEKRSEYEHNIQTKEALCEKVEEVTAEPCNSISAWTKRTEELEELFKLWKTVGPINKKQSDELWARYSKAVDAFYANKKEYFSKIKEQQMDNYNQKLNLCVEAEALQDSSDWRSTSREFIRLQEEWKKIGPVPMKFSDKIWQRFRSACDKFFNNKDAHFANREAVEPENLKAKEALIEELKNYAFSDSKTENLDCLKDFQRRWMSIGFVPIKEKERLQTEYRAALGEKMRQLNISAGEISTGEGRPSYRSGGYQASHDAKGDGPRKEIIFLQNKIATMQDEINLWGNNIGFLAKSKNADILKQEFEKKIQRAKNELEINIARLNLLRQELFNEEEPKKGKKEE